MFKDDDDDEEENTFGVTRYPCMPSLVALQQMRNRLHLAFLGRKLMKWTALATGREMRRMALQLYEVYHGFGEDMRNAFITLARGRYFCPQLNYIVTENVGTQAGVVVQHTTRTVSAVKVTQFGIYETETPPYTHLGIGKGGQAILEAKKAWLDLLKRLIMMLQLRTSFLMVEQANKNATKKMNVLSKIVIPKTNVTLQYISNELEEYAREEFFRLKKILEIKKRMYGDKKGKTKKTEDTDGFLCFGCLEEITEAEKAIEEIEGKIDLKDDMQTTPNASTSVNEVDVTNQEVEKLINQLNSIVDKTTDMDQKGILQTSTNDFLKTAKDLMSKLGQVLKDSDVETVEVDGEVEVGGQDACRDKLEPSNESMPLNEDKGHYCKACREIYSKNDEIQTETEDIDTQGEDIDDAEIEEDLDSPTPSSSDVELDTCETEFKEITKITKTINEDGSVTIQKKVIKIEKEIRNPVKSKTSSSRTSANKSNITGRSSNSSSQSKPHSNSKTVGQVALKNAIFRPNLLPFYSIQRKVKSEILGTISPMCSPGARYCMSSVTLSSADVDFDHKISNDCNFIMLDNGNTLQQ